MTKFFTVKVAAIISITFLATAANTQVFSTVVRFDYSDGSNPGLMSLAQGGGSLYGTTAYGGPNPADGTIFKLGRGGLQTLHSFCQQGLPCTDGSRPEAGLMLSLDGNFYGTTPSGGDPTCSAPYGCGTVFKINPSGVLTTLHNFEGTDGASPFGPLIQAVDGNFYGTTSGGGNYEQGTVFRMTPSGTLTTLHSFSGDDGARPQGNLLEAEDGNLYGTTLQGGLGSNDCSDVKCGTVFKITPAGNLTTLYSFCSQANCADGAVPMSGLVEDGNGNLYGTTYGDIGIGFGVGTIYRIGADGTFTTMYSFCVQLDCTDGATPIAGLAFATDGNLYGTTQQGGSNGSGTIFKITPTGTLTTLYSFCNLHRCADGSFPYGGVTQGTDGNFYGTTYTGGADAGVIYRVSEGLAPFVIFVRAAGKVGQMGPILGQGFTGTTSVTLNGTPVTFTVVSDTCIKATVPAGATTGYVTVTTPTGVLTSNVPFHVIQ